LQGMHERAERIGARLKIRSRPTTGTEVELSVPGQTAYQEQATDRAAATWLARLRPRRERARAERTSGGKN
jgi:hypothetical protein